MEQENCTTKRGGYKHLTESERYKIEGWLEAKLPLEAIAQRLNKHRATVYREIKRGTVKKLINRWNEYTVYRANTAELDYQRKAIKRRHALKIDKCIELIEYIRDKILRDKYSPDAIVGLLKQDKRNVFCTKTLYGYIDRGVIEGVGNYTLWEKRKRRKRRYKQIGRIGLKNTKSRSIEDRPKAINQRLEYGHWEGDCVVGKRKGNKAGLFTLSERLTREELIVKVEALTQEAILTAVNKLEVGYGDNFKNKFKSITFDNGSEFLDWQAIEQSSLGSAKRTTVYFAHSYSAWERGTNENQNRMIRRFIPKGTDISAVPPEEINRIQDWMNNYPRRILGYKTPNQLVLELANNGLGIN